MDIARHRLYLEKSCGAHFMWRCCDAGIRSVEEAGHGKGTIAINTYLRDGLTWSRLAAIATLPEAAGGLALMRPRSREYRDVFDKAPPGIIEDRPETYKDFLEWLVHREHTLKVLCNRDFEQRRLTGKEFRRAQESLNSRQAYLFRRIDVVLLQRGLSFYYHVKKHHHICSTKGFDTLVDGFMSLITSVNVDQEFLDLYHISKEDLGLDDDLGAGVVSWIEVSIPTIVLLLYYGRCSWA